MLIYTTFSIVARCERTGKLGVAVSTAVPAVGAICPHARAGVGAICTQSFNNPYYGYDGLRMVAEGLAPEDVLARLTTADPGRAIRQVLVVDAAGNAAAFTGEDCVTWNGQHVGEGYAVAGNMLTGPRTIEAMAETFETTTDQALEERLMRVLEAGQAGGGDKRGRQSAALYVVDKEEYPCCDLRVDDHPQPVAELRRILEVVRAQLFPFMEIMPTRANPAGRTDKAVEALLALSPDKRPQRR